MDRNLGATSATSGDVGALGLLYQWGRKDPFLGSSEIDNFVEVKSSIIWPEPVGPRTIQDAIQNPTTFFYGISSTEYDWQESHSSTWNSSEKSIYDPCPAGWRVPSKDILPTGKVSVDSINNGVYVSVNSSLTAWYPVAGYRSYSNGSFSTYRAQYWSSTGYYYHQDKDYAAYHMQFSKSSSSISTSTTERATACSIRCVKE